MAAMRFEQVQRLILAKKVFWGYGHFKGNPACDPPPPPLLFGKRTKPNEFLDRISEKAIENGN